MLEIIIAVALLGVLGVTITYSTSISGGGVTLQPLAIQRTGDGPIGLDTTLPASQAGSLTTRTSDTVGEITMTDAGHTITTGAVIDVYWDGGVQYSVTVGTVSGTAVPISSGSGDVLPSSSTAVTVVVQTVANLTIDGDEAEIIAVMLESTTKSLRTAGHVQFVDASDAEIAEIDLVTNVPQVWDISGGSANPFTGNIITKANLSQAKAASGETYQLKIVGVQDATP